MPFVDLNSIVSSGSTGPQPAPTTPASTPDPITSSPVTTDPVTTNSSTAPIPTDTPETTTNEFTPQVAPVPTADTLVVGTEPSLEQTTTPNPVPITAEVSSITAAEPSTTQSAVEIPVVESAASVDDLAELGVKETKGPDFNPEPVADTSATKTKLENDLDSDALTKKLSSWSDPTLSETVNPTAVLPPVAPLTVTEEVTTSQPEVPGMGTAAPVAQDTNQPSAPVENMEEPDSPEPVTETEPVEAELPTVSSIMPELPNLPAQPAPTVDSALVSSMAALQPVAASANSNASSSSSPLQTKNYSLAEMLEAALSAGASDLHVAAGYRAMMRVDGQLVSLPSVILDADSIANLLTDVVKGSAKPITLDKVMDLDLSYKFKENVRFRVNIFRQQGSLAAAFRLIADRIKTIEELGMPYKLKEFVDLNQGLILVTGPTGSGKSTTIAAIINEINQKHPKHIITIEDPIEYVYPKGLALVDQREMGKDTNNWNSALRSALRQDPNVVMIGEMRDLETISSALTVAETGHLVFATLHTNSAAQSIDRVIDVFPPSQQNQIRSQLASVIKAVISQRLVPVRSGGRKVVTELLIVTPAVANAIREQKVYQIDNMIQTGADVGMMTMESSLVDLVRKGEISTDQALIYANKPADVLSLLGKKGT